MTYPQSVQLLIDNWNARVGGLDTLRILADELEACGDERMALACRDAVVWFETATEVGYTLAIHGWFWQDRDERECSRFNRDQWWKFHPNSPWHAIELYADFPPLGTERSDTALNNYAASVLDNAAFNARIGSLLTTTGGTP